MTTLATLPSPIVALLAADDRLILAAEDGTVAVHDARTFAKIVELRHCRPTDRLAV